MPTMEGDIAKYREDGSVETVRANLEGAKYTLAVPKYTAEKGLKDFADIAKFEDDLDGKIYGIEPGTDGNRSEDHTSELQSLIRISYAVLCLKKQNISHIL